MLCSQYTTLLVAIGTRTAPWIPSGRAPRHRTDTKRASTRYYSCHNNIKANTMRLSTRQAALLAFFASLSGYTITTTALDEDWADKCRPGALRTIMNEDGTNIVEVDITGEGFATPGHLAVFDGTRLSHVDSGNVVGRVMGHCLATPKAPPYYCTMTFVIDDAGGSSITMQGMFNDMIVTGGSGCYEGATGHVVGKNLQNKFFRYSLEVNY